MTTNLRRAAVYLWGAAVGLVAAVVSLGVAELVSGIAGLRSPVIDVGDRVIDNVPPWLKDLAIRWFGTNDKVALLVGIGVVVAVVAAVIGIIALRGHPVWGAAGIAMFGVVGAAAALGARTHPGPRAVLPALIGAVAGVVALLLMVRLGRPPARPPETVPAATTAGAAGDAGEGGSTEAGDSSPTEAGESGPAEAADAADASRSGPAAPAPARAPRPGDKALSRRALLGVGAALAAGGLVAAGTGRWLGDRFSAATSRARLVLPGARRPLAAAPAEVALDQPGITPFFTPNADFYRIDTALLVPQVPVEDWTLRITGLVDRPMQLSFTELVQREVVEADITLTCVSNEVGGQLAGTARWLGVRLDDLLRDAGIKSDADQVVGRSVDGYTCGFPVAALDGRDALVAIGMNGEPLPLEHGFPARLIVPGLYGYVSATKWLTEIELTRFDRFDQYWVPRGWDAEAPIKTFSRIDTPKGLARVPAGPTALAGVAWAQLRGIQAVQVRIDDGPWTDTELAPALNDVTWRQWRLRWDAAPGRHTVTVRAIDGTGAIQTDERSEPMPNGATGHHQIVVLVAG